MFQNWNFTSLAWLNTRGRSLCFLRYFWWENDQPPPTPSSLSSLGHSRPSGIHALCALGLDGIVGWWPDLPKLFSHPTCQNYFPTCQNNSLTCLINFPTYKWFQKFRKKLSHQPTRGPERPFKCLDFTIFTKFHNKANFQNFDLISQ